MQPQKLYDEYMITTIIPAIEPIEIESALGTRIRSSSGEEYLDCFSGISVCNAGHGHPKVMAAAKAQIDRLVHCCTYMYYNPMAGKLAEALARITPGRLRKSFLANSGAEAIEGSLRLARHFTGRNEFLALTHSFHGRTYAALSLTGNSARKQSGGPFMNGVTFAPAPYFYRCPFGSKTEAECAERSAEALARAIQFESSGNVAAFVAEPVLGEGGILVPHESYFKQYEASFIFRGPHLSTFGGNPVCCAAALANIEVMQEEKLSENSAARGAQFMNALKPLENELTLVGEVRGRGLMIGLEVVEDADKTPAVSAAKEIKKRCREAGILIGVGGTYANVVRLQPPLVITEDEAAQVIDTLSKVLREVNASL